MSGAEDGSLAPRQGGFQVLAPADLEALAGTLRGFHSFAESGATYGFPRVSEIGRAGEAACASLVAGRALPEAYRLAALGALLDSLDAWFAAAVAIAALGAPAADPAAASQAPAVTATASGLPPAGAPAPPRGTQRDGHAARFSDAAEGRTGMHHFIGVDPDHPGVDLARDPVGARQIRSPEA